VSVSQTPIAERPALAVRRLILPLALAQFICSFAGSNIGIGLLLGLVEGSSSVWAFVPGLFLFGFGLGGMLTPSVNVVQSSFPEELQGEISGLSRSVSNLGSSFGTAIAGTILVSVVAPRESGVRNRDGCSRRDRAHRTRGGHAPSCKLDRRVG
jgi:MFS family permease